MEVEVVKKTSKGIKAKIAPWIAKLKKIKNKRCFVSNRLKPKR